MTGREYTAEQAGSMRLVSRVVPADALVAEGESLAVWMESTVEPP